MPIPGAKDLAQARENLGALGWRLRCGAAAVVQAQPALLACTPCVLSRAALNALSLP